MLRFSLKAASSEREHDLVCAALECFLERVACDCFAQDHSFTDSSGSQFSPHRMYDPVV